VGSHSYLAWRESAMVPPYLISNWDITGIYHVLTLPQSLLGALLMEPARLPMAFNVVFLLSVIVSGWFAALLLKQLTDRWIRCYRLGNIFHPSAQLRLTSGLRGY
jgi:hypothetical protein